MEGMRRVALCSAGTGTNGSSLAGDVVDGHVTSGRFLARNRHPRKHRTKSCVFITFVARFAGREHE